MAFGPDDNLYVTSDSPNSVLRYDGATGAFVDEFISARSEGPFTATELLFVSKNVLRPPPPPTLRWEFEATVIDIVDPAGIFSDVRLGDPVRGSISYDLAIIARPFLGGYAHDLWFQVVTMVIENPRSGEDVMFKSGGSYEELQLPFVSVFNDVEDADLGTVDIISAVQYVVAPPGFTGSDPVIVVQFLGPPDVLDGDELPTGLDIEDWPLVGAIFQDLFEGDVNGTGIFAELFSLMSVPIVPGDFDSSGEVDLADYNAWRGMFGEADTIWDTDGNGDGIVGAADYVVWRNNLLASASGSEANVPEPASLLLLSLAVGGLFGRRVGCFAERVSGRRN